MVACVAFSNSLVARRNTMDISSQTALVTGSNRGLGRHLAAELLARGATVYAGARRPESIDLPGVHPIALDITDPASVRMAASQLGDVTLVVNNAGSSTGATLLDGDLDAVRLELDTHFYGTLNVVRAFTPVIEANSGGAFLNVLSVLSWINFGQSGAYSAAKSAEWSMTNGLRIELAPRGIRVAGLHVGYMDTDMTRNIDAPKADPAVIAKIAVDGLADDAFEIVADDTSRQVMAGLAQGVSALYPALAVA
jgi:NAD(P)-dependent dehydrogenase (short-subunit alcohol dehydrogenase family)